LKARLNFTYLKKSLKNKATVIQNFPIFTVFIKGKVAYEPHPVSHPLFLWVS